MSSIPFTTENVRHALAINSDMLRQANILGVWLDMSGSGWTQSYVFTISEKDPVFETVVPSRPIPDGEPGFRWSLMEPVQVVRLRSTSIEAVRKAIETVEVPDEIVIEYRAAGEYLLTSHESVWPARTTIRLLREKIATLRAELLRFEELDQLEAKSGRQNV